MKIQQVTLDTCAQAAGLVVVIDVIRAFTTACYAFEAGAEQIVLVGEVAEAFALREQFSPAKIMGEVGGLPPEGFDYGNSPSALIGENLTGHTLIQRTSAGTQGVVRSINAEQILAASFACAEATIQAIQQLNPDQVTLVSTGIRPEGYGDEDVACADYIEQRLQGYTVELEPYLARVLDSKSAEMFRSGKRAELPVIDLDHCVSANRVSYALRVERQNGLHVMTRLEPADL